MPGISFPLASEHPARPCGDGDIELTAAATPSSGVHGGTFGLSLIIRNASASECSRDIGSAPQEMRVLRDGVGIWSSNDCGAPSESDLRTFPAGAAVRFTIQWSSYRIAPDTCRPASEPAPPATYQAVARLGDKVSAPVTFTIVR